MNGLAQRAFKSSAQRAIAATLCKSLMGDISTD